MTFDKQATQAAAMVHDSLTGLEVKTRLDQLVESHHRRRRMTVVANLVVLVLVVGGGAWLGTHSLARHDAAPPAGPSTTKSPVARPVQGTLVGGGLGLGLLASVPDGFTVTCDCNDVTLTQAKASGILEIETPVSGVYDPSTGTVDSRPADYVGWLRSHPWLQVLEERRVQVNGTTFPRVTVMVRADASDGRNKELRLAALSNNPALHDVFTSARPGQVFSEAVLDVDGNTILVRAVSPDGALSPELTAGLDALLDSLSW